MINSGAIIVTALIKNHLCLADRYDHIYKEYKRISGGEFVGFNNAVFLSERESANRNFALAYFMKEYNCFPPGIKSIREELDFYFQLCSLETHCEAAAGWCFTTLTPIKADLLSDGGDTC